MEMGIFIFHKWQTTIQDNFVIKTEHADLVFFAEQVKSGVTAV